MKRNVLTTSLLTCLLVFHGAAVYADLAPLASDEMADITGQDGISIRLDTSITTNNLAFHDTDGIASNTTTGVMNFYDFAFNLNTPLTMHVDLVGAYDHDNNAATQDRAAVFVQIDDIDANNSDLKLGTLQLDNNVNPVGYLYFKGLHASNTHAYIVNGGASGEGLTINAQSNLRIDEFALVDTADDTTPGAGSAAVGISGITMNSDYTASNPSAFIINGLTIDVESSGLVIGLPSMQGDIALQSIHAGGESGAGIAFRDIDIGGGKLYISGH